MVSKGVGCAALRSKGVWMVTNASDTLEPCLHPPSSLSEKTSQPGETMINLES